MTLTELRHIVTQLKRGYLCPALVPNAFAEDNLAIRRYIKNASKHSMASVRQTDHARAEPLNPTTFDQSTV
ncbi:MAG: hypothetical protein AAGA91_03155 [Pseudomonadota bacterium]